MLITSLFFPLLAGCDNAVEPCDADIAAWEDQDGDGWGGEPVGKVCKLEPGQVEVAQDCDDGDDTLNPDAIETCDGIDNDCDGQIDDDANLKQWWFDGDGDGFGGLYQSKLTCEKPGTEWVANANDCDDQNPSVNPAATEVCGRIDEDCDGYIDEADDSVDPASFSTFYADRDGDGFGDRGETISTCRLIAGYVLEGNDCDDGSALLTQREYWADADGDGYGDPAAIEMGCRTPPQGTVDNDDDCDDTDANVLYESDWFEDVDGDGYGSGVSLGFACLPPFPETIREGGDCDETTVAINPGMSEICEDGIDQDCSGNDISCGPVGSFLVEEGPDWGSNPPVYNCLEACALIFGGTDSDYSCSTSSASLDNRAFLSGWGDGTFCFNSQPEDFKVVPAGGGYNCGSFGCAYSAYVRDNCSGSRNWCWPN